LRTSYREPDPKARTRKEVAVVSSTRSGYGRNWKKWIAIYLAVAAVAYFLVYLLFFTGGGGGGGGGGFHY
jgi:hypothetical protein